MSAMVRDRTILVTGARGGIGQALVKAFLDEGAARVIAADRSEALNSNEDSRVRHVVLDVTDPDAARKVAATWDVDVVVNNAGVNGNCGVFDTDPKDQARNEMEVNYFGVLNMARAFTPAMKKKRSGAMVQVLSFAALSNIPAMATYSASKAAARSLTQALRAEMAMFNVRVINVYPRIVDTAMTSHLHLPKTSAEEVARAVMASLAGPADEVYPGNAAASHEAFLRDPAGVDRENAKRLPQSSIGAAQA
jgi:NAD(P)-dependent dehydrogenase (short-subunit alcohol dehydrogenase family)